MESEVCGQPWDSFSEVRTQVIVYQNLKTMVSSSCNCVVQESTMVGWSCSSVIVYPELTMMVGWSWVVVYQEFHKWN